MDSSTPAQLLAEFEDILRTMPSVSSFFDHGDAELAWMGRASAAIGAWSMPHTIGLDLLMNQLRSPSGYNVASGRDTLLTMLHEAAYDLRMKSIGPVTTAIGEGQVLAYFDELRTLIETANNDVLFVDPYLDADFVARYLPHVTAGVPVRLLGRQGIAALTSAVSSFCQQHGLVVEIRSSAKLHDRYLFLDRKRCFQSGASFKDGGNKATTLTEISDTFPAMSTTYEQLWSNGTVHK